MQLGALKYKYKYNTKELQNELGLNWYDYGARNYEAALGRFMSLDPLAENRTWLSPYNYVQNNPLSRIDPDGQLDWEPVKELENAWKVELGDNAKTLAADANISLEEAEKAILQHPYITEGTFVATGKIGESNKGKSEDDKNVFQNPPKKMNGVTHIKSDEFKTPVATLTLSVKTKVVKGNTATTILYENNIDTPTGIATNLGDNTISFNNDSFSVATLNTSVGISPTKGISFGVSTPQFFSTSYGLSISINKQQFKNATLISTVAYIITKFAPIISKLGPTSIPGYGSGIPISIDPNQTY